MHLNSLPITLLKVDRSFVGGMELREENRKLVHAMINLAHNLNRRWWPKGWRPKSS